MISDELFKLGPYKVYWINIFIIGVILLVSMILRRLIHRNLKRYLKHANIRLEGRRVTWLKLFSQSVYAFGAYLSIISFKVNNENASFKEFLDYKFIDTSKIKISFENVILVIVILFCARLALNLVKLYLQRRFRSDKKFNIGTEYVYVQVAKYIIYIFAFIFILSALDVQPTIFLGGSFALLAGIGLGLQDVFKDMFSGFVLLFEGSIRVGDIIELHGGKTGDTIIAKILRINVRTTQIETREGNVLIVPNTKLTQEYVENWSHGSTLSRFKISILVSYGSDTELVSRILKQAALSHPKVNKDEDVSVRLNDFGENGLMLDLLFWADQSWDINVYKSEIRFEIDRLFRQYGVEIPFPQRNVHIHNVRSADTNL